MSNMQAEVFAAFRSLDIPEDKAMRAAEALSKRDDDVSALRSSFEVMRWMIGFNIALTVAVFIKLFIH